MGNYFKNVGMRILLSVVAFAIIGGGFFVYNMFQRSNDCNTFAQQMRDFQKSSDADEKVAGDVFVQMDAVCTGVSGTEYTLEARYKITITATASGTIEVARGDKLDPAYVFKVNEDTAETDFATAMTDMVQKGYITQATA